MILLKIKTSFISSEEIFLDTELLKTVSKDLNKLSAELELKLKVNLGRFGLRLI